MNGRLTTLTRTLDGLPSFVQTLTYNSDGTLASRTYPDGKVQTLAYSAAQAVPTATGFNGTSLATLGYDPTTWNLIQVTYANGGTSGFTYDFDQTRLSSMTHAIPGASGTSKTWTYSYNALGRLSTDGEDWYTYDNLGRLTSAFVRDVTYSGSGANSSQGFLQQFGYDAFGNRSSLNTKLVSNWAAGTNPPTAPSTTSTSKSQTYAMTTAEVTTMGAANHLPSTAGGVATGALYDRFGNLTQIYGTLGNSATQLAPGYDALGRVTSLGDNGNATTQAYTYDDEGLRIKLTDSKTGLTTYNLYNEARQLVATYTKTGSGSLTWKKDILYVGTKELAEVDTAGTEVTLVDHLGSPRYAWRGSGTYLKQKFLPFGESLDDPTSAAAFAKGFTNHEQTDPSGLIYMQARFYAPWYGRFLSPDPARDQHFEETQSWNIYSYVQNNPTMRIDPNGMVAGDTGAIEEDIKREPRPGAQPKTTSTNAPLPKPAPGVIKPELAKPVPGGSTSPGGNPGTSPHDGGTADKVVAAAGLVATAVEQGAKGSPKVATLAKAAGAGGAALATAMDGKKVVDGEMSPGKFVFNAGMTALPYVVSGPEGWAVSGGYSAFENFYPGGFNGLGNDLLKGASALQSLVGSSSHQSYSSKKEEKED